MEKILQNQVENESLELSSEEITDLRQLESLLISLPLEQDKNTEPETPEDIKRRLYSSIEEGFLKILPQVGFERDESLETRTQEEGLSLEELAKRQEDLTREYVQRMQKTPNGWGFTPAIASRSEKEFQGLDCLGATIALAALLRKNGIEVRKGQTAGHAMVLAKIGDILWYADGRNGILIPVSEQGKHVKNETVYELTPETISKLNLPYNLLISSDIKDGSIACILDNMKALKDISEGLEQSMGSEDIFATDKLYQENKHVLGKRNWSDVGTRLTFPGGRFMDNNESRWQEEEERIKGVITGQSESQRVINELFFRSGYKTEEELANARKKIIGESLPYKHQVLDFLAGKSEMPQGLSNEVANFFELFKEKLDDLRSKGRIETEQILIRMTSGTLEKYEDLLPKEGSV